MSDHEHQWIDVTTYEDQPGTVAVCECGLIHRTGPEQMSAREAWDAMILELAKAARIPQVLDWIARKVERAGR